ncbi:CopG family transcriptional regulator [soil metagenome]
MSTETRNITLSLPRDIIREVKVLAARQDTSVSRLLTQALEELVYKEREYERAKVSGLALMDAGKDLGTNGSINWTRDELHERG